MKAFVSDIERSTRENPHFRRVLFTAEHCQLVVMTVAPGEDIGMETHDVDQFLRIEEGTGEAILDGERTPLQPGFVVLVPAGTAHDIVNTGAVPLKLYTLYAPPHHRHGVVHRTRADAQVDDEHFDGVTSV